MNKEQLLDRLASSRETFLEPIDSLPDEAYLEPGVNGTWCLKDILVHLTLWEAQLVTLLFHAKNGKRPQTAHFTQENEDVTNQTWLEQFKDRPLAQVLNDFLGVRNQTLRRVEIFSDQALTDPGHFPWAKNRTLMEWVLDDTINHEKEHGAQIQVWLAQREG